MTTSAQTPAGFCADEYPRLVRALSLYVGDLHVAQELAQEALLRACQHWPRVSQLESPGGWTWRVAVNLANSKFRRIRAERLAHQRLAGRPVVAHTDPDVAAAVAIRRAVVALPPRQRTAVVLRFVADLSIEQTAEVMQASTDAVRSLTKRATTTLRQDLDDVGRLDKQVHDAT